MTNATPPHCDPTIAAAIAATDAKWQRRMERERTARQSAERLLEEKSLALYHRNQELTTLYANLEQQIKQRTLQLALAKDEAIAANTAKTTFLANLSHAVRTPLTAILGMAENLRNAIIPAHQSPQALNTIVDNGYHLLSLLNDILDISKIEVGITSVHLSTVELFPFFALLQSNFNALAQQKGLIFTLTLDPDLPTAITTDPTKLRQILFNLLHNAVKFTTAGEVAVTAHHTPSTQQLFITICDSGIGISPETLERLFTPFVQGDDSTTRSQAYQGGGMGLYIAQKLAQLLNGIITVKSQLGKGSTFTLTLPCSQNTPKQATISPSLPTQSNRKPPSGAIPMTQPPQLTGRVLVADDSPVNLQIVSALLQACGLKVTTAENGEEAVEKALSSDYDLLLMDIQMPKLDGRQAFELLTQLGYPIPVIALTANVMQEDIDDYLELGFRDTLAKPIQQETFFNTLRHYLTATGEANHQLEQKSHDQMAEWQEKLHHYFIQEITTLERDLRQAIAAKDSQQSYRIAHRIKGSAGNVGYHELSEEANFLQIALKNQSFDSLESRVNQFAAQLHQLINQHPPTPL